MKKITAVLLFCLFAGVLMSGCGTVDSPSERWRRYKRITDMNLRQAVDDWDYIWLYDHNSRMTQWHPRVGQ